MVDDVVEVRREAAISLRFTKGSDAAKTWTRLALKYDGKDRWYLEALGIGADKNPNLKFKTLFGHVEATEPFEPLLSLLIILPCVRLSSALHLKRTVPPRLPYIGSSCPYSST